MNNIAKDSATLMFKELSEDNKALLRDLAQIFLKLKFSEENIEILLFISILHAYKSEYIKNNFTDKYLDIDSIIYPFFEMIK